jgi:hypothetical protein
LEDVPHEGISARYHVQAISSELTWTSAFDATAVVAILINLTFMHLIFVPFEVFVSSQGFFFHGTVHGIFTPSPRMHDLCLSI